MADMTNVNYNIEPLNSSDYRLTLVIPVDTKLFNMALNKGLARFNIKDKETPPVFDVHEQYLNFLHTSLSKDLRNIKRKLEEEKEEPIKLLNTKVVKATFTKSGERWDILVRVEGQYLEIKK